MQQLVFINARSFLNLNYFKVYKCYMKLFLCQLKTLAVCFIVVMFWIKYENPKITRHLLSVYSQNSFTY